MPIDNASLDGGWRSALELDPQLRAVARLARRAGKDVEDRLKRQYFSPGETRRPKELLEAILPGSSQQNLTMEPEHLDTTAPADDLDVPSARTTYIRRIPHYGAARFCAVLMTISGGLGIIAAVIVFLNSLQMSQGAAQIGFTMAFAMFLGGVLLIAIGQAIAAVLDTATHTAMIVLLLQDKP